MAQIAMKIPKGSWLDQNGKRWTKATFDVMVDNGQKFLKQIQVTLGMHFDFSSGFYMLDLEIGKPLTREILRQYPSLKGVKNPNFIPTTNRLLK